MSRCWTKEEVETAREMRRQGKRIGAIAQALNRSAKAVTRRLNEPDRGFRTDPKRRSNGCRRYFSDEPIKAAANDVRRTTAAELGSKALLYAYQRFFDKAGITPDMAWRTAATKSVGQAPSLYRAERKWA